MSGAGDLILHGYWRSGASHRVRIALNIKGLDYAQVTHDLRKAAHKAADYHALNPQSMVPALEADGQVFIQSSAILEWIEERHPWPALLPRDPDSRAVVRAMAMIVACDMHPLGNLRVQQALRGDLGCADEQVTAWLTRWMRDGFAALESLIARHGGRFAYGDMLTIADCHLVPQLYSARRFGVPMDDFPHVVAAAENALTQEPVARASPENQPDADR